MRKADAVTIETQKPLGPSPGTFSSTGAISESGTLLNSSVLGCSNAPDCVTVDLTQRFEGALGTFTLRAAISQKATDDPHVLSDYGGWVLIAGTGVYETPQGRGRVTGTADYNLDLAWQRPIVHRRPLARDRDDLLHGRLR
jgi:hypothetical protein